MVLRAVSTNAFALQWAAESLRDDDEVVIAAVTRDGWSFQWASNRLKHDRDFVLGAVRTRGHALLYAADCLRRDRQIVECAERTHPCARFYAIVGNCDIARHERTAFLSSCVSATEVPTRVPCVATIGRRFNASHLIQFFGFLRFLARSARIQFCSYFVFLVRVACPYSF